MGHPKAVVFGSLFIQQANVSAQDHYFLDRRRLRARCHTGRPKKRPTIQGIVIDQGDMRTSTISGAPFCSNDRHLSN